jgi:hypothetical protein
MTAIQRVAQVFGWVFIVVAIWGAAITGTSMDADMATADRLWGLFPVNLLHNLVHLAFGVWGILAARSYAASRSYALLAGALYIVLAVAGLFFPDGFGLVPLGGNDIWLHAFLGAALLVAGLTLASRTLATEAPATRPAPPPTPRDTPAPPPERADPAVDPSADPNADRGTDPTL